MLYIPTNPTSGIICHHPKLTRKRSTLIIRNHLASYLHTRPVEEPGHTTIYGHLPAANLCIEQIPDSSRTTAFVKVLAWKTNSYHGQQAEIAFLHASVNIHVRLIL